MNQGQVMTQAPFGILYGLGIGPGDPELITLKALRILEAVKVIAYPAAQGRPSFARRIVAPHLKGSRHEILIEMPMSKARSPAQAVYDKAAKQISDLLEKGADVAVLCEGDPLLYGSFMYILERLQGSFKTEIIPGISSLTSCAAVARIPMASRNDQLTILTGPMPDKKLKAGLEAGDAIAIMKVGRHLPRLIRLIREANLLDKATYIEQASLENQSVMPLTHCIEHGNTGNTGNTTIRDAPYFSMILIHSRGSAACVESL